MENKMEHETETGVIYWSTLAMKWIFWFKVKTRVYSRCEWRIRNWDWGLTYLLSATYPPSKILQNFRIWPCEFAVRPPNF